jgi:NAD(P)-dependent dehydrogenase (short-subunit alcohol dehydrogenase family)
MNHSSKIVLISGCSSGFGLLTSARLASRGYTVIATMRNLNKRQALLDEAQKRGGEVEILPMDVTNKLSVQSVVEHIEKKYGRIDVLVNNAGYGLGGFFEDITDEEFRAVMETNFFGAQNVTRAVLPIMRKQRSGKIINISSIAGQSASPAFSAYNCSKWALEAFSESLRYEMELFGIQVLVVEPGTYKTDIFYDNARYARNFDNILSPYYARSQHFRKLVMNYVEKCKKPPEKVAALIEKLIETKNPPFRNRPDIETKILLFFRKTLPFSAYSWIIKTSLSQRNQSN